MKLKLSEAVLKLNEGRPIAISAGQCVALEVLRGRVWLTEEHSAGDRLPGPGERVTLAGRGTAVIEPLGAEAEVRLLALQQGMPTLRRALEVAVRSVRHRRYFGGARIRGAIEFG